MVLVLHPQQVKCWSTISALFALYLTYLLLMKLVWVYNIGPSGQLCTSGLFSSAVSAQDKAADPSRNVSGEQPMSIFLEIILLRKTNRLVYTWPSAHQSFVTSSSPLVRSRFNTLSAKISYYSQLLQEDNDIKNKTLITNRKFSRKHVQ